MTDELKTVTIVIPSGYRDAADFLKDCEFEAVNVVPSRDDLTRAILKPLGFSDQRIEDFRRLNLGVWIEAGQSADAVLALLSLPGPVGNAGSGS